MDHMTCLLAAAEGRCERYCHSIIQLASSFYRSYIGLCICFLFQARETEPSRKEIAQNLGRISPCKSGTPSTTPSCLSSPHSERVPGRELLGIQRVGRGFPKDLAVRVLLFGQIGAPILAGCSFPGCGAVSSQVAPHKRVLGIPRLLAPAAREGIRRMHRI
jgi:hypothetical protein